MKLADFMDAAGIKDPEMAERIGKDRTFVSRLRRGLVKPSVDTVVAIERATGGAVKARDFVEETTA